MADKQEFLYIVHGIVHGGCWYTPNGKQFTFSLKAKNTAFPTGEKRLHMCRNKCVQEYSYQLCS